MELPAIAYEFVVVEETPVKEEVKNPLYCSCVLWLNHLSPKMPTVDARHYAQFKLSKVPTLGSAAVFRYRDGTHHVAKVIHLGADKFRVSEANFKNCLQGERDISYLDSAIIGYFTP